MEKVCMKLWILRPVEDWEPWYDKAFGFIVCAETKKEARKLASSDAGNEGKEVWFDSKLTSCKELKPIKKKRIILKDFASA